MAMNKASLLFFHTLVNSLSVLKSTMAKVPQPLEAVADTTGDPLGNLADLVYVLREAEALAIELKRDLSKLKSAAEMTACHVWQNYPPAIGEAVGEYCTGKPHFKKALADIKRDGNEEVYDRFCREVLHVLDQRVIESGAIAIHYQRFSDWYSQCLADGQAFDDVVNTLKGYTELHFSVKKTRGLLEESAGYVHPIAAEIIEQPAAPTADELADLREIEYDVARSALIDMAYNPTIAVSPEWDVPGFEYVLRREFYHWHDTTQTL